MPGNMLETRRLAGLPNDTATLSGLSLTDFMRRAALGLTARMEDLIGTGDAEGYLSAVGSAMGRRIDATFRAAKGVTAFDTRGVADVLVDYKRQVGGCFVVEEATAERIVMTGHRCPFGADARGCGALCQTTANIFGRIAADNLGYAHVALDRTMARGDKECRVTISLVPPDDCDAPGQDFYGTEH